MRSADRLARPRLSRRASLAVRVLAGVAVVGLLLGCDPVGPGPGTGGPGDPGTSGGEVETPTEISSALFECTEREKGLRSAPKDLSGWAVVGPAGYHRDDSGTHFAAIEGDFEHAYFNHDVTDWPNQVGLNYFPQLAQGPVTNDCGQLDPELVTARIAIQAEQGGAEIVEPASETEIAGLPAWVVTFTYPGYDVSNVNYFVYGVDELIHVECQWRGDYEADVRAACDFFLAHLTVT